MHEHCCADMRCTQDQAVLFRVDKTGLFNFVKWVLLPFQPCTVYDWLAKPVGHFRWGIAHAVSNIIDFCPAKKKVPPN